MTEMVSERGKQPATGSAGHHQGLLSTDSFISAASFQEPPGADRAAIAASGTTCAA